MLSNRPSILSMASSSKSLLPHSPMRKASTVRFADDDDKEEENYRLRASIKRKHTDRIYQWLHVGCGSCFLHENNGGNITDILKEKSDYEREFPKQLQRQMFLNYIDCSVPWKDEDIEADHICPICYGIVIEPRRIGNDQCPHYFCKWCIEQWYVPPQKGAVRSSSKDDMRQKCPMCRQDIVKLVADETIQRKMMIGIPTTIWQQTLEQKLSSFWRKFENDEFERRREAQIEQEQVESNFQNMSQQERHQMAGYGVDDGALELDDAGALEI